MQDANDALRVLQEVFQLRRSRNPRYSLRAFARQIELSPSLVSEILSGKRRITSGTARKILARLRAGAPEDEPRRRMRFSRIRTDRIHGVADWYYFAILSLAETQDFRSDPEWVGERLNIPAEQAAAAIERLLRLRMIKRLRGGDLRPTGRSFSTPDQVVAAAARVSHFQGFDLARGSLERDPVEVRDFSAMTMAIDPARLPAAKRMLRAFRRRLSRYLEAGERTEVYRLSIQLFPLSARKEEE